MSKSRNGEGSIFPNKDKKGRIISYSVEMSMGRDADGKRVRTRRTVKTLREAKDLRTRLANQSLDGNLTIVYGETLRTFGLNWIKNVAVNQVRATTASHYEYLLRKYVFPTLGSVRLIDLRPTHVDRWMTKLRREGLSASTVNSARQVLGAMCKNAERGGTINRNPVSATNSVKKQQGDKTRVCRPWELEEIYKVLAEAKETKLDAFLHLMLHTGIRPGEALGLRWEDIDLEQGYFSVTGTQKAGRVNLPNGRGLVRPVRNDPKTAQSRRRLPISEALAEAFDRQQMRQSVDELKAGPKWIQSGYVLTSEVGTPHSDTNLRKHYKRFLEAIGVRYIRLHDLRHTTARAALNTGEVPIEQVSQAFGHSRLDTTHRVYGGNIPRYNEAFVKGLSEVLPAASSATILKKLNQREASHDE